MSPNQIQSILRRYSIPFVEQGIGTNINCPYCLGKTRGLPDDKFRCGIFGDGRFSCFRCKRTGTFFELLSKIANISRSQYENLTGIKPEGTSLSDTIRNNLNPESSNPQTRMDPLPGIPITKDFLKSFPIVSLWLEKRRVNPNKVIESGCKFSGYSGWLANRIVFPIEDLEGNLVAWQARDLTDKSDKKYVSSGPIGKSLYFTDLWSGEPVYLVEGILDAWRLENNAIASFSHSLSSFQKNLFLDSYTWLPYGTVMSIKDLIIAWDGDSFNLAKNVARELTAIIDRVGVVRLPPETDPDCLGRKGLEELEVRWLQ